MPPFIVGQFVVVNKTGEADWGEVTWPKGVGRVEKITGTPYSQLTVGVRWRGWEHGHNLEGAIHLTPLYRAGGWWCHPTWLDILSPEEATLWLLAE